MPQNQPKHYWLASMEILFTDSEGVIGSRNVNALIITDNHRVARKDIGQAQQGAQVTFFRGLQANGLGEEALKGFKVRDVFMQAISYLGRMSHAEFHAGYDDLANEQAAAAAGLQ